MWYSVAVTSIWFENYRVVDPGLKPMGVLGSGLKTWLSWVLNIQQSETHVYCITQVRRYHHRNILYIELYTQIFPFMKIHHFWKVFSSQISVRYGI